MNTREAITYARKTAKADPQLAAHLLRDLPEVRADETLTDLAFTLASGNWGCCESDVIGLIDAIERSINK